MSEIEKPNTLPCRQTFCPAENINADEYLALAVIKIYKVLQIKTDSEGCADSLPCARCGHIRMAKKISRNSLSRYASIMICYICGVDEAVRIYADCVKPLSDWWAVSEILGHDKIDEVCPGR